MMLSLTNCLSRCLLYGIYNMLSKSVGYFRDLVWVLQKGPEMTNII